jgi:hypothetical protein
MSYPGFLGTDKVNPMPIETNGLETVANMSNWPEKLFYISANIRQYLSIYINGRSWLIEKISL